MKDIIKIALGVAISLTFLYGCFWLAKTVSYNIFYESMVQQEITEMVKPECLR